MEALKLKVSFVFSELFWETWLSFWLAVFCYIINNTIIANSMMIISLRNLFSFFISITPFHLEKENTN